MKQRTLRSLILIVLVSIYSYAFAYDFEFQGLYYNILSPSRLEVELTERSNAALDSYVGIIKIPETVTYNNKTYTVIGIEDKCFYNNSWLTEITIPKTIQP